MQHIFREGGSDGLRRSDAQGSGLLLQDRLNTLDSVRKAGISVCAGGIIGMGEGNTDRVGLLHQLATLPEHPESVPINALVAVKGTPLQVRARGALGFFVGNAEVDGAFLYRPDISLVLTGSTVAD